MALVGMGCARPLGHASAGRRILLLEFYKQARVLTARKRRGKGEGEEEEAGEEGEERSRGGEEREGGE